MTSLTSLVRRGDTGSLSPVARRVAIALAVLTPLLIAGVAVTALVSPTQSTATSSGPALPAAVVNQDVMVDVTQSDGSTTPVLAGKLLVSELTSGTSGEGFTWNVTDADTAAGGLKSGQYAAVVTIPSNFSASYVSISGSDPVQAQLQVQTNGANSYVTEMLASALSTNLQAALSTQATKQFVSTTLGAFTSLNSTIGQAATAADQIAGGADKLATGSSQLATGLASAATGGAQLNVGAQGLATGLSQISAGAAVLPDASSKLDLGTSLVSQGVDVASAQIVDRKDESQTILTDQESTVRAIDALLVRMPEGQDRQDLLAIREQADSVRNQVIWHTGLLDLDDFGMQNLLVPGAAAVSDGAAEFASKLPLLTDGIAQASSGANQLATGTAGLSDGLNQLSSGAADLAPGAAQLASATHQLAGGLHQGADAIPTYTTAQQDTISTVVANPVVTEQSDIAALPSPAAAIAAVAVPMALWIGAFAIYLMLAPFTRRALASTASTFRVVVGALWPAVVLGLVQAAIVALVLFFVGAHPEHVAGSILFSLFMSFAFVTLHQGLVALFGQAGRLLSLALVVVQIAAAAVIIPNGLSSPLYTGLSSLLPLSHAITGMQALIGGGSLTVVAQEALVLLVFAGIGLALSLIAVTRRRSRSLVPFVPLVPAAAAP